MNQPSEPPSPPSAMVLYKGTDVEEAWVLILAWPLTFDLGQGQSEGIGLCQCF